MVLYENVVTKDQSEQFDIWADIYIYLPILWDLLLQYAMGM